MSTKQILNLKNQKILKLFLQTGGRKGAKSDFYKVLGKASKGGTK